MPTLLFYRSEWGGKGMGVAFMMLSSLKHSHCYEASLIAIVFIIISWKLDYSSIFFESKVGNHPSYESFIRSLSGCWNHVYIYMYIHTYICVCVCVCMYIYFFLILCVFLVFLRPF